MTSTILPSTEFIRQAQLVGNKSKGIAGVIPFLPATLWRKIARASSLPLSSFL